MGLRGQTGLRSPRHKSNRESYVSNLQPPRSPHIEFWIAEVADGAFAVVRLCWFRRGRASQVREFTIYEASNGLETLYSALQRAEDNRLDALVITPHGPEELGLEGLVLR